MKLQVSKKEFLAQTLDRSGANRLIHCSRPWSGLMVLNYHRVGDPTNSLFDRNLWSATPEGFDDQVRYLSRHFDVISPLDLPDVLKSRSGQHVLITFDDGYRDNFEYAYPILKSYGVSGTFFLATGFLDQPKVPWWDEIAWMIRNSSKKSIDLGHWQAGSLEFDEPDREQVIYRLLKIYKSLPGERSNEYLEFLAEKSGTGRCPKKLVEDLWMTWDMVREMSREGMHFGGHTVSHPVLSTLDENRQKEEICQSGIRINEELGYFPKVFSYPVGGKMAFTEITEKLVKEAGYQYAFSYYGGFIRSVQSRINEYDLPRVPIEMETSCSRFRSLVTLPQIFA